MQIAFIGDSHVQYFSYGLKKHLYKPNQGSTLMVSAATCYGLHNANSKTKASEKINSYVETLTKDTRLFFQLGEVDCGILIWLKAQAEKTPPDQQAEAHVKMYIDFLNQLRDRGHHSISVTSATLPTINDMDHVGEVVTTRRSKVNASFRERTDLTLHFNNILAEACEAEGLGFISADESFLDPNAGLVGSIFRNKRRGDHHMDNQRASVVWAGLINESTDTPAAPETTMFASEDTYLKKFALPSKALPPEFLFRVRKGDEISTHPIEDVRGHRVARGTSVNGEDIGSEYQFLWPNHFRS